MEVSDGTLVNAAGRIQPASKHGGEPAQGNVLIVVGEGTAHRQSSKTLRTAFCSAQPILTLQRPWLLLLGDCGSLNIFLYCGHVFRQRPPTLPAWRPSCPGQPTARPERSTVGDDQGVAEAACRGSASGEAPSRSVLQGHTNRKAQTSGPKAGQGIVQLPKASFPW